jgi:Transposase IS200 like
LREEGGSSAPPLDVKSGGGAATMASIARPIHLCVMNPKSNKIVYRGYPGKLHHEVPHWVESGSIFHIRIAIDREKQKTPLTAASLAQALTDSARLYQTRGRWHITLFLLMPDHLHALLSFPIENAMSRTIGEWKHFLAHEHRLAGRLFRSPVAK